MPSSIPSFKSALLTRLQAEAGLSGVQISWGHPYPKRLQDELIIIGRARNAKQVPVGLGSNAKEETYNLELLVSVVQAARNPQQGIEQRAYTIAGVIETSLTNWRTEVSPFGGIVSWALVDTMEDAEILATDGDAREASVIVTIAVTARI